MEDNLKNLCVFIHYSTYPYLPKYAIIYLNEVSKYFDQVILVTNQRTVELNISLLNSKISTQFVKNEGYDLGMFYKVFQTINPADYRQIACINDSNTLINSLNPIFEWSKNQKADFWGVIDSNQKPSFSTHEENYHIQSHFIVFSRNAILKLPLFFDQLNIRDIFEEKDPKKIRQTVINKWEIGLSQFLLKQGLKSASYIDSKTFSRLYYSEKNTNVGLKLYPELIRSGFPLLKIKVITKGKWKDIFRTKSYWKNLIREFGNQDWEIESLIQELNHIRNNTGNQPLIKLRRKLNKIFNP